MKTTAQIILEYIAQELPEWIPAENAFLGHEPESPILCLTTFDYEGWVQDPKLNYDMDHVQIRCRSNSYSTAWEKIKKINVLLNGISPFNWGDERVEGVWVQSPPMPIGRDSKSNFIFTTTIRVLIIRSELGNRQ
jgi:hypothetical protein